MKKISIDNETLNALINVSESDYVADPNSDNPEKSPDPKYVMISFFNGDDKKERLKNSKTVPNPTIYNIDNIYKSNVAVDEQTMESFLIILIREHVKKYGTIDEIRFRGHGGSGNMGSGDEIEDKYSILTYNFLDEVTKLEKELGIKIANRIVFDGCKTFSKLNDYFIKYYSDYAKEHKIQIVGTTSDVESIPELPHIGRFVQFAPDGKIIRDKLDTRYDPLTLLLENDRSWTDFCIGHTAEEGVDAKKGYEIQQKNEREAEMKRQEWQNKCADRGPKI